MLLQRKLSHIKYLLFVLPAFLLYFVLGLLPNLQVFYLALFKWNGMPKRPRIFVGLRNFTDLTLDPMFLDNLISTFIYIILLLVVQTVIIMALSLALSKPTPFNRFFRTLFFAPLIFSSVMVSIVWSYMYDPNIGILNYILETIGLGHMKQVWIGGDRFQTIASVVFVHIWHNIGYGITMLIAGLNTIPDSLHESAMTDGASPWVIFWKITFPLLLPTLLRVVLLTLIGGALAFDYVFTLSGAMVSSPSDTLSVFMFRRLVGTNIGIPSAVGASLSLMLFAFFIIQNSITRKIENSFL